MKYIKHVDNYSILRNWVVHKEEDYVYLTGKVTRSYKFADGSEIYTSEILGMAQFKEYIMFETHNTFYKCFKKDHALNCDDLLYLLDQFPQFTKESFKQFFQEIQHLSTLNAQSEEKKKIELFPKECERGYMLIFNKHSEYYFESLIIKNENEEVRVEEHKQAYVDGVCEVFIYVPIDEEKKNAICLFTRNEHGVYLLLWNRILGDVYICNYSKDTMVFMTEDQKEIIDQNEVVKVYDNGQ